MQYSRSKDRLVARRYMEFMKPSRTKQSEKPKCDVNTIMRKAADGQLVDHVRSNGGIYGDFTDFPDFHMAKNIVAAGAEAFERLPSKIRERFANDPGAFIQFMQDPSNEPEMRRLGLLKTRPKDDGAKSAVNAPSGAPGQGSPQSGEKAPPRAPQSQEGGKDEKS